MFKKLLKARFVDLREKKYFNLFDPESHIQKAAFYVGKKISGTTPE